MFPRTPMPESLVRLATAQAGVLSYAQIKGSGAGDGATARWMREWPRIAPRIYLATRSEVDLEPSWEARLWAGILLGEGRPSIAEPYAPARIGGLAAAVVQGLADRSLEPVGTGHAAIFTFGPSVDIDVHVDSRCRRAPVDGYRFIRSARLGVCEQRAVPCTPVVDTVLDLCDLSSDADAMRWADRACQRRVTTADDLAKALEGRPRSRHRRDLRVLLRGHAEGVTSEFERLYREQVERAHGMPTARRQLRAGSSLLDNRYDPYGVIVELDGREGHIGEGVFRDRRRDNRHTLAGQRNLRYGWWDCRYEPCELAAEVATLLMALGWDGTPTSCDSCPPDIFSVARPNP